jgi:hypothetical protein
MTCMGYNDSQYTLRISKMKTEAFRNGGNDKNRLEGKDSAYKSIGRINKLLGTNFSKE